MCGTTRSELGEHHRTTRAVQRSVGGIRAQYLIKEYRPAMRVSVVSGNPRTIGNWCVAAAALIALATACSGADSRKTVADSALERDLTLAANAERPPVVTAQLGDTAQSQKSPKTVESIPDPRPEPLSPSRPAAPKPDIRNEQATTQTKAAEQVTSVSPTPAPLPFEPAPATTAATGGSGISASKSLGVGTALIAHTSTQLCSLANRPGDRIVANLAADVSGPDGARLPAGTPIVIEMATAEPPADFAFRVKGVQVDGKFISAEGTVASAGETTERRVANAGDKGKVATGAVIGAILGRVIGGGTKGTVIGAAGGAAAGSVMAARNSTVEHCLPSGATITVTLSSPLVLPASSD